MVKLVIFDLDGVLISAKDIHYQALNKAIGKVGDQYSITRNEHLNFYDGLKTTAKLLKLTKEKKLPISSHDQIWSEKQKITQIELNNLVPKDNLTEIFNYLKSNHCKIACCSNSIRTTVYTALSKIGAMPFIDLIISNEDVKNSKPHPEMYWNAMSIFSLNPEDTLIVEDSPHGLLAAQRSGAKVLRVKNPDDLTKSKIKSFLNKKNEAMNTSWQDKKLNVLIPMAGAGSRFEAAGYTFPKPLIEVKGKPMIQVVVENLNCESPHTFLVQQQHREKYNLDTLLNIISPDCNIIEVNGITQGAACTTLLSKDIINNNNPLLIANSDQYVDWNTSEFLYKMQEQDADAGILTFESTHPKWSFVKINEDGDVIQVAEKNPISNIATVGIYYWKKGSDYVKYAEKMIEKNIRHNNEFYVCPVFNEAIKDGKKIKTFDIKNMWGLGTPEDLNYFLKNHDR
ncbi:MAG: HAD-IA family hydrolase [Candidatus Actinomarinaceae bacterium]